jgi:hypothetical protein
LTAAASLNCPTNPSSAPRGPIVYVVTVGTPVPIPCTKFARRVEIQENDGGTVGINVYFNDGSAATYGPADYPVVLGPHDNINGHGSFLGVPAQVGSAATIYCSVQSAGGSNASIDVWELD